MTERPARAAGAIDDRAGDDWARAMIGRGQEKSNIVPLDGSVSETEELPYWIELWAAAGGAVERVLARAVSAELARAIFKAAQTEHPNRRITLRRGRRIVADTDR